ncbi:unnamed protein product [Ranitomeya imitator]|uniref:Uncharacterized protein n=1 Tax=Ranitomeya imitator TaxID=111125 RepID=A0ABN9KSH5_9NEOB|nr:unnamed protein product [Ranitomeya imitator]
MGRGCFAGRHTFVRCPVCGVSGPGRQNSDRTAVHAQEFPGTEGEELDEGLASLFPKGPGFSASPSSSQEDVLFLSSEGQDLPAEGTQSPMRSSLSKRNIQAAVRKVQRLAGTGGGASPDGKMGSSLSRSDSRHAQKSSRSQMDAANKNKTPLSMEEEKHQDVSAEVKKDFLPLEIQGILDDLQLGSGLDHAKTKSKERPQSDEKEI